jgi:hypothetical protein
MTNKEASIIISYLKNKETEFKSGLEYWMRQSSVKNNDSKYQRHCEENIIQMQAVYNEIASMIRNLKVQTSPSFIG